MAVVAMGSLAGGGANLLGPLVAQRLGADYVDRLILTNVARQVGATVEALHQREERAPTRSERFARVVQRVLERSAVTGAGGDPYFGPGVAAFLTEEYEDLPQPTITRGHEVEDEKYIEALRDVLTGLADGGNVVIVGRGGPMILKDMPSVLRVGLIAHRDDRIKRIMERERLTEEAAGKTVEARDRARAYYFKRFFGVTDPDNPYLYHIVINTSDVDLDYATDLIVRACADLDASKLSGKVGATP